MDQTGHTKVCVSGALRVKSHLSSSPAVGVLLSTLIVTGGVEP